MKKKIAFFQNDLDVGGIQKSAVNLMRNMDYDRFEMHLFLSKKQDFWNLDFPKELQIHYLNPTPRFYSFVPFDYALKHIHYDFPKDILFDLAVDFNSYQCSCAVGALTVPARKRVMFIHNDVNIGCCGTASKENSSILMPLWREPLPSSNRSGGFRV